MTAPIGANANRSDVLPAEDVQGYLDAARATCPIPNTPPLEALRTGLCCETYYELDGKSLLTVREAEMDTPKVSVHLYSDATPRQTDALLLTLLVVRARSGRMEMTPLV
jgi:hypothetical protein